VVSPEALLEAVWGGEADDPALARTAVARLRRKLEAAGSGQLIHARRGQGYILTAPIRGVEFTSPLSCRPEP
jgi:DNA-binding response OmpR family regulator